MKVLLFTVSEGAFNRNGSLTIVNTYDSVVASSFPAKIPLAIALQLANSPEDVGAKTLSIVICNRVKARELTRIETRLDVPETEGRLAFAANTNGFAFPEIGIYSVSLEIDGVELSSIQINVKANGQ